MSVRAAGALVLLVCACSSGGGQGGTPPPDFSTIFDPLAPATPNKLRGVWGTTQRDDKGTVEIRIAFTDGYALGGARCMPTSADKSVVAGTTVGLQVTGLDEASGTFTTSASLSFSKKEDDILCQVTVANAATYEFTVTDEKLTLSIPESTVSSTFEKLGD